MEECLCGVLVIRCRDHANRGVGDETDRIGVAASSGELNLAMGRVRDRSIGTVRLVEAHECEQGVIERTFRTPLEPLDSISVIF